MIDGVEVDIDGSTVGAGRGRRPGVHVAPERRDHRRQSARYRGRRIRADPGVERDASIGVDVKRCVVVAKKVQAAGKYLRNVELAGPVVIASDRVLAVTGWSAQIVNQRSGAGNRRHNILILKLTV